MRNGFTLIELLLVVVIIGILAALALPNFSGIQARAHKASMQSDLRNLATAEVLFAADSSYYDVTNNAGFTASSGNVLAVDTVGENGGFKATATRADLPSTSTCSFEYASASSANAVTCSF